MRLKSRYFIYAGEVLALSLDKLKLKNLVYNPVLFMTALASALATLGLMRPSAEINLYLQKEITILLWLTLGLSVFIESLLQYRGRRQLQKLQRQAVTRYVTRLIKKAPGHRRKNR